MNDFQQSFTDLVRESDSVVLPPPEAVRGRADRRARLRVAVAVVGAVVAVAGIAAGAPVVLGTQRTPGPGATPSPTLERTTPSTPPSGPTPPSSAAPSPSAPTSTSTARPAPTAIADRAFLQVADTNDGNTIGGSGITEVPSDEMLPSLCGAKYASRSSLQARRTKNITYWATTRKPNEIPDGTFRQTITTYRPGGGASFMTELRRAVGACPRETVNGATHRNRLVSGTSRGDDSVVVEVTYPARDPEGQPTGQQEVRLVSVVRIGDVVMVLYETGWESSSADRAVVDRFTATAVSRLRAWLG
jgi:hypothetical protein